MDIHGFDFNDWEAVFIDPDIGGLGGWMAEFDRGTDIFGRDFKGDRVERDGGVIFYHAFKCLKKDRIDFIFGESFDIDVFKISKEPVQRRLENTVMQSAMILFVQPIGKEAVKVIERVIGFRGDQRQEAFSDRTPEPLYLSTAGRIIGSRVNQSDADSGADLLEVGRGKDSAVVAIKDFGESISEEGVFEDAFESLSVFLKGPGGADDESGMIVDNAAEEELVSDAVDFKVQTVHKIREPEIIDVRFLELFSGLRRLGFGLQVIVDDELSDGVFAGRAGLNRSFIDEHAVEGRDFERRKLIEFLTDDGFKMIIDDSG